MKKYFSRFLMCLLSAMTVQYSYAQLNPMDSLKNILIHANQDSVRVQLLDQMIELENDDALWPLYNDQMKKLCEKNLRLNKGSIQNFYLKHLAHANSNVAFNYKNHGDVLNALKYYTEVLNIQSTLGEKKDMALTLNDIAYCHIQKGDVPLALTLFSKGIKILEDLNSTEELPLLYNNMGTLYLGQADTLLSLQYLHKSLAMTEKNGDKIGMGNTLNNIGLIYFYQHKDELAKLYHRRSLQLRTEAGNLHGVANSNNNIGWVFAREKKYDSTLLYCFKSLVICEKLNAFEEMESTLSNIGSAYAQKGDLKKAQLFSERALAVAKKTGYPTKISNASFALQRIYQKAGNYKGAFEMFELFILMRDSVNNQTTRKAAIKTQLKYEYEKKALADSVKNKEEQKVKDAMIVAQQSTLNQEKTQRYALYGGLTLTAGFLFFVMNRFRLTQKQKKIIEAQKTEVDTAYEKLHEKNKEVLDSINYASRIQRALLPSEKYIGKNLNSNLRN